MTTAFAGAVLDADGRPFDRIRLTGLSSTGHHGVFEHERAEGQLFRADVVLHLDTREAARGDDLADTVSYAGVAEDVVAVLAGSPADLIETVAERIAATILTHPDVVAVDVAVHKPQAPLTVPFDDVEVVIRRDRVVAPVVPPLARRHDAPGSRPVAPIPVGSVAPALIHGVEAPRDLDPHELAGPDDGDLPLELAEAPAVMPPSIPPTGVTGAVETPADREPEHDLTGAAPPRGDAPEQSDPYAEPETGPAVGGAVSSGFAATGPVPGGPVPAGPGESGPVPIPPPAADPATHPVADDEERPDAAGPAPAGPDVDHAAPHDGGPTSPPSPAAVGMEHGTDAGADAPAPAPVPVPSAPADAPSPGPERPRDRMDEVPADFVEVVLALGANLGDAQQTLRQAITDLDRIPGLEITDVSPLARTAAVGPEQPDYLNTVLLARTRLSARDLMHACQDVEHAHGRVREERWGPRTLDVDLVVYGSLTDVADDLELPHPRAHERAFVLEPWSQVDPDAVLPGLGGGPVAALAATAPDRAGIRWLALDWLTEPAPNPTGAVPVTTAGSDVATQPDAHQPPLAQPDVHRPAEPSAPHPADRPVPPQAQVPPAPAEAQPAAPVPPQAHAAPQAPVPPQPAPPTEDVRPAFAPVSEGPRAGAPVTPPQQPAPQQPASEQPDLYQSAPQQTVPQQAPPQQQTAPQQQQVPPQPGVPAPIFSPVHPVPGDARDAAGAAPSAPADDADGIIRGVPFAAVTAPQPVAAPGPLADPALHQVVQPTPAPPVPHPAPPGDRATPPAPEEDEPRQDLWPPFPPVSGQTPDQQR